MKKYYSFFTMIHSQKKSENFQDFAEGNEKNRFCRGPRTGGMGKLNEKKMIYLLSYRSYSGEQVWNLSNNIPSNKVIM